MGLEDFIPSEGAEGGAQSAEIAEKIKEGIKAGGAGVKRVQKDEQKAKKYDMMLAYFLKEILQDKQFDVLLTPLFKTFHEGYSSHFILGLLSLVYLPISHKIREMCEKQQIVFHYIAPFEEVVFHDETLDDAIKTRINQWIEDVVDIASLEYSSLQIQKIKQLFHQKESYEILLSFTSLLFQFFFTQNRINITSSKSKNYTNFILGEVYKKIETLKEESV